MKTLTPDEWRASGGAMDSLLDPRRAAVVGRRWRVSGAKNAALPISAPACSWPANCGARQRAASCTTSRPSIALLRQMGVRVERHAARRGWRSTARRIDSTGRAVRAGQDDARVDPGAGPAGRALRRGTGVAARRLRDRQRPVDQHIRGSRRWAPRSRSSAATSSRGPRSSKGARIVTDMVTVTGTENLMMAAAWPTARRDRERGARARGRRPRPGLVAMGARIEGAGHRPDHDQGVAALRPAQPPDHGRPDRGRHAFSARPRPVAAT